MSLGIKIEEKSNLINIVSSKHTIKKAYLFKVKLVDSPNCIIKIMHC